MIFQNNTPRQSSPPVRKNKPLNILLIEDDPFDSFITGHYLKKGRLKYRLQLAPTGKEALNFLYQKGPFKKSRLPDLILIDIGLPDVDGRDLLAEIKKSPQLSRIPTVILTGQNLDGNPVQQYGLLEHAYINKWLGMRDFLSLIKAIADFHIDNTRQ